MNKTSSFWMFTPFNTLFFIVTAFFILLLIAATLLVKNKSTKTKKAVLVISCIVTLIGFFFYKLFLSKDADYNIITANMGGFNWWGELPLQLCNINMIMIPIAVLTEKRPLLSFCFFVGPIGAAMAILMPGNGFDGYSLLLPRMLGYFGTHYMIVIEAIAICTFGLYRPKFKDFPFTIVTLLCVAFGAFLVSMLLRVTGLHSGANYFFSVETEGNFILEIFHRFIPVPFLYLLPSILILLPYTSIVTLLVMLGDKKKQKKRNEN